MLRPIVFVGCGGSGVRTVHRIREELERQLREHRYKGPFPKAWQFLTIDVPSTNQAGLGGSNEIPYIGLAEATTAYRGDESADSMMMTTSAGREDYLKWRPNPDSVHVNLAIGAGQYRAVGRVAASTSGLSEVSTRVKQAATKCIDDSQTLSNVCRALGIDIQLGAEPPEPKIFLISSLGGGAGSGIFLDVADAIRLSAEGATGFLTSGLLGVLYDPSVFDTALDDVAKKGIPGNTLAAVSELVAGQWAPWTSVPHIAGGVGRLGTYAGLEYAFLVGSSNGAAVMQSADEVYTATARALAALTLNPSILSKMEEVTLGNWVAEQAKSRLNHHRPDGNVARMPFSAMGYSMVDLGRRRFAVYAEERIASQALRLMATRHITPQVESGRMTGDEAAMQRVRENGYDLVIKFLNNCGLNEDSPSLELDPRVKSNDQVLDAIIDIEFLDTDCPKRVESIREKMTDPSKRLSQFDGAVSVELSGWKEEIKARHRQRAVEWAKSVQEKVIAETLRSIAFDGLLVTSKILDEVCVRVGTTFPNQLIAEMESGVLKQWSDYWDRRELQQQWKASGRQASKQADDLVGQMLRVYFGLHSQRSLRELVAPMLKDMADNFLSPLRDATVRAMQLVNKEIQTREFKELSTADFVSRGLDPAKTEILIDGPKQYPKLFNDLVTLSAGTLENCLAEVIQGRLVSDLPTNLLPEAVRPFTIEKGWVPEIANDLVIAQPKATAKVELLLGTEAVRGRAQYWLNEDPSRPIRNYIATTLAEYLSDTRLSQPDLEKRVEDFGICLGEAFAKAKPLVDVQWNWTAEKFSVAQASGSIRYTSKIPLAPPGPKDIGGAVSAAAAVAKVLSTELATDEVGGFFEQSSATSIDVFSMLRPMPPSAFLSLTKPIIESKSHFDTLRPTTWAGDEFWLNRRARPFLEALPLLPAVRLTLARGWITGLLTNRLVFQTIAGDIRETDLTRPFSIVTDSGAQLEFAHPPIGSLSDSIPSLWRKTAALALMLNGVLYAEMLAAQTTKKEALDAVFELLNLGTSSGDGIPRSQYGGGLHPALKAFLASADPAKGDPVANLLKRLAGTRDMLASERAQWSSGRGPIWSEYPPHLAVASLYEAAADSLLSAVEAHGKAISKPPVDENEFIG